MAILVIRAPCIGFCTTKSIAENRALVLRPPPIVENIETGLNNFRTVLTAIWNTPTL